DGGPGNLEPLQLGGTCANIGRENLAGGYPGCASTGNNVQTQTGNETGPTSQGINTRFGDYTGPMGGTESQYPPDVLTTQQSPPLGVGSGGPPYPPTAHTTHNNPQHTPPPHKPRAQHNQPKPPGAA